MSVAIYLPHLRCGGAEVSVVRLAEAMAARGIPTRLIIHRSDQSGPLLNPKVEVVELDADRSAAALPKLAAFLRHTRPRVLLSALTHNNLVAIAAGMLAHCGTKVVVSEHAPISHQVDMHGGWRYRALPHLLPPFYSCAHGVVAVSRGVAEDMAEMGCTHRRMVVIHNPVLPCHWQDLANESLDDPWLRLGAPPVMLSAGRLSPEKDFTTLLRAFHLVRRQRPDVRMIILGEGPERQALSNEAERLGLGDSLRLPGYVANPFPMMRRAALFALSSLHEGFGNVLVEAMACGTPVISTDCPVGPREILDNGRWGRLVPVGATQSMADAMLATLAEPSQDIERRRHAELYSADASVDAYLRLFAAG